MKTFLKGALVGGLGGALVLAASSALAGTGVGSIFNLGQTNTVNGTSTLTGSTAGSQLKVSDSSTAYSTFSLYALMTPTSPGSLSAAVRASNAGTSTAGFGLWASHAGGGTGVYSTSVSGTGVWGKHTSAIGAGPGVEGDSASTSASAFSLYGLLSSASPGAGSAAVRGRNNATSANGYGVWGSHAGSGSGVYGTSVGGNGVFGKSTSSNGVQGSSGSAGASGVYGENTSTGGYGVAGRAAGNTGMGVYGDAPGGGWAGYFTGQVHVGGSLDCSGCIGPEALSGGAKADVQSHVYRGVRPYGATVPSPDAQPASMVSVSLPAGTYLVIAKAMFFNNASNFGQNNFRGIECWIDPGSSFSFPAYPPSLLSMVEGTQATLTLPTLVTLASPAVTSLDCRSKNGPSGDSGVDTYENEILALKIAQLN